MSSRKFINNGDYQLVLDNGRLIVKRPDAEQETSAIEIAYTGSAPSGYVGVTGGAFKYGFDDSVPFDVYHEGRPPRVDEVDFADQPAPDNVFYVAENGIDSNDGKTLASPLRTIKAAAARADRVQAERMEFLMIAGQDESDYNDEFGVRGRGRIVDGGENYANGQTITLTNGAQITVDAVDGQGAVTEFTVAAVGQFVIPGFVYGQDSVSAGSGDGFKLKVDVENLQAQKPQRTPVSIFLKAGRYTENNPIIVNRKVAVWGDTLRSAFVSPRTKTIPMRARISGASLSAPNPGDAGILAQNRATIINQVINSLNTGAGLQNTQFGYERVMDNLRTERYRRDMDRFITAMIDDLEAGIIDRTQVVAIDYYLQIQSIYPEERELDPVGGFSPTQFMLEEFVDRVADLSSITSDAIELAEVFRDTIDSPEVPDPANPGNFIVEEVRPATVSVDTDPNGAIAVNGVTVSDAGYGYRQTPVPDALLLAVDTAVNPGKFDDAARLLRINRTYIKDRIAQYVDYKLDDESPVDPDWANLKAIGLSQENRDLCKRDTGYILDGIIQDLLFGGSEFSIDSASTYRDNGSVLPQDQREPTIDTFEQIIALAEKIIRKQEPDPLYPTQVMAGIITSGVAQVPEPTALIIDDIISDLIDGINNTIAEPSPVYKLRVVGILDERPGPQNNITPAIIEFDVVDHALTNPVILEAGANLTVNPVTGATESATGVDVSSDIPHPDDSYDLFYVNTGSYFSGMTFNNLSGQASAVAFDPLRRDPLTPFAQKGHITTSPYTQNCSTINLDKEGGIGMKINGKHTRVLRSMVCDAFTQINTAGTGVYLLNRGYAQLVSIFTVSTNIGIRAETGGLCSVANSNSSFGNFGLLGRGVSEELDSGTVDTLVLVFGTEIEVSGLSRRPAFGDAVLFDVTYPVTVVSGNMIVSQDQTDFNGASGNGVFVAGTGYSLSDVITLSNGAEITVDAVGGSGQVTQFTVSDIGNRVPVGNTLTQTSVSPSGGTGFTLTTETNNLDTVFRTFGALSTIISDDPRLEIIDDNGIIPKYRYKVDNRTPLIVEFLNGFSPSGSVTARLRKYYTVNAATPLDSGSTTVTLDLGVTQEVASTSTVRFYQRSLITTSSHTFEYVGGGTNFFTAIPAAGGAPIRANEIIEDPDLGGSVFFTSTDDRGDFRIGPELTINRNTGTITGEAFERSLFAILTPYILSLET